MNSTGKYRLGVIVCLAAVLHGCSLTYEASTLGVSASMGEPAGQTVQGEEFEVSKKAVFLLFGILRASTPSLEHALAAQLVDGSEVQSLNIKARTRFTDILISVLTAGLIVTRSVTYKGTVIQAVGN